MQTDKIVVTIMLFAAAAAAGFLAMTHWGHMPISALLARPTLPASPPAPL